MIRKAPSSQRMRSFNRQLPRIWTNIRHTSPPPSPRLTPPAHHRDIVPPSTTPILTSVVWGGAVSLAVSLVPHGAATIALSIVVAEVVGSLPPTVGRAAIVVGLWVPSLVALVVPPLVVGGAALPWTLVAVPALVVPSWPALVGGAVVSLVAPATAVVWWKKEQNEALGVPC